MRKSIVLLGVSALLAVASFALDVPANKLVDATWLKKNIADKSLVLVMADIGTNYDKEHINNSIKWTTDEYLEMKFKDIKEYFPSPLKFTNLAQKSGINNDSVVVFYATGIDHKDESRAAEAMVIAQYYGLDKVAILNGGLAAWKKSGNQVSNAVPNPLKGNFKISKFNTVMATLLDVDAAVELNKVTIVDARYKKHYDGTDDDKRLAQHGKIEGAVSIPVDTLYTTTDGIVYIKSGEELKSLFKTAGVDIAKPLIAYCNSGQFAASLWFASKYLVGIKDSKEYKPSMIEYSQMPPRKVIQSN